MGNVQGKTAVGDGGSAAESQLHHGLHGGGVQFPYLSSPAEAEERRRHLTIDAQKTISMLTGSRDIGEANIFFFSVEGLDMASFARRVASKFGVSIVHGVDSDSDDNAVDLSLADTRHRASAQHMTLAEIDEHARGCIWSDASSAIRHLTVRQERHLVTIHRILSDREQQKVRFFVGSPAEDLHLGLSLTLDGNANRLDVEMLHNTIQRRWMWFNQAIAHGCSVYVYIRIADTYFQQMICQMSESPDGMARAVNMKRYRAAMDDFVESHAFIYQQHVVTIEVRSRNLGDQTAFEVGELLSEFINKQYDREAWRRHIKQDVWDKLATNSSYRRECRPVAVHDVMIAGPTSSKPLQVPPHAPARTTAPLTAQHLAANAAAAAHSTRSSSGSVYSEASSESSGRGSRISRSVSSAPPASVASSVSAAGSTKSPPLSGGSVSHLSGAVPKTPSQLRSVSSLSPTPVSGSPPLTRRGSGSLIGSPSFDPQAEGSELVAARLKAHGLAPIYGSLGTKG